MMDLLKEGWQVQHTTTDSFLRRRRWWGWQTRAMTPDERAEYFVSIWCWRNR